ncbi:unnamed protein product [Paramecium sonneborni]|uniref:Uncharacterized protein n=1 Tax=Paramecium sonneborni TaxID=65129 RepID=A0A8S1K4M2_9CILI|nr:unnamed protein product [Paramecium sonneborni]
MIQTLMLLEKIMIDTHQNTQSVVDSNGNKWLSLNEKPIINFQEIEHQQLLDWNTFWWNYHIPTYILLCMKLLSILKKRQFLHIQNCRIAQALFNFGKDTNSNAKDFTHAFRIRTGNNKLKKPDTEFYQLIQILQSRKMLSIKLNQYLINMLIKRITLEELNFGF